MWNYIKTYKVKSGFLFILQAIRRHQTGQYCSNTQRWNSEMKGISTHRATIGG